jgi:hypothetical protein
MMSQHDKQLTQDQYKKKYNMKRDPDAPSTSTSRLYLLVDSAQYPGVWRILQYRFRRLPWLSLFEDTSDEEIVRTGPVLIRVETDQTKTLAWFLEHTQEVFGLSWILSPLSLVELRGHLNGLMCVEAADGSECAMRFFDTRILPVWYDVLCYEQKLHAFGPIVSWSFINRDGMECTLKGKAQTSPPQVKTLHLSHAQEYALLDAALPDLVIQHLSCTGNADLEALPHHERYPFIAAQVEKAKAKYQIGSLPELVLFCMLALSIGTNFDQLESVAQVLQGFAQASSTPKLLGSIQPAQLADHHYVPISLLVSQAEPANTPQP